jgi:hypothetical protein
MNTTYNTLVRYGFDAQVSSSRIKVLKDPCALNIFVKSNTILNNLHLKFIDSFIEEELKHSVEMEFVEEQIRTGDIQRSEDEVQQLLLSKLELKKAESIRRLEVFRAISSEYVFLVLEEFLRESNIRDCKGDKNLSKKASLMATIGLTLEQVLDFADTTQRSGHSDNEMKTMIKHLGLVLLSYLKPPSALAIPESFGFNKCFGASAVSPAGVFMDDEFW